MRCGASSAVGRGQQQQQQRNAVEPAGSRAEAVYRRGAEDATEHVCSCTLTSVLLCSVHVQCSAVQNYSTVHTKSLRVAARCVRSRDGD